MNKNIFAQVRQETDDFVNNYIEVVPGYSFSQYQTLKRIHLYSNDRFENGQTFMGRDKIFFNICNNPTEVAATLLDFDTKNIKAYSRAPRSYDKLFLFNKEMEYYLKENDFSTILNDLAIDVARYGSAVLQKTSKGIKSVDLRKLVLDPTVKRIADSRFISIQHELTSSDLREMAKKNRWDMKAVEEVISKFGDSKPANSYLDTSGTSFNDIQSSDYIKITERYGEVPESWLKGRGYENSVDGKTEKMVKSIFIIAGADQTSKDDKGNIIGENGVCLFKSPWYKKYPFMDFHYTKTKGRWLGIGVVEKLFPIQIRFNELKNQLRFAMELSTKRVFQTRDRTAYNNILTDIDNGQILLTKSEITPVVNEERNLGAYNLEEGAYYKQAQDLTFAYEAVRGDLGSNTTATAATIATQRGGSVFEFKKENIGNDLRNFFNQFVKDDIIKSITPAHVLIFSGNTEELNIFDEKFAQSKTNKYFIKNLLNGKILTPEELDVFKNNIVLNLKKGSIDRQVIIEEDYFADSDIWLDFNFTNEAFDANQMFQGSNSVLIALAQNPTILQDPRLKVIFYKYMESLGINPQEIELAEKSMSMGGPTPGQFPATSAPALPPGAEGSPMGTSNMPMKANSIMK
jgi:hypothetical protein